jgi:hypothetical protein
MTRSGNGPFGVCRLTLPFRPTKNRKKFLKEMAEEIATNALWLAAKGQRGDSSGLVGSLDEGREAVASEPGLQAR